MTNAIVVCVCVPQSRSGGGPTMLTVINGSLKGEVPLHFPDNNLIKMLPCVGGAVFDRTNRALD